MISANLFETHSNTSRNTVKYRIVNDASLSRMYEQLSSYELMSVVQDNNCVVGLGKLMNIIQTEYDNQCPMQSKVISNKSMQKPWITGNIISNIKKEQSYYNLYCQNKISKDTYVQFRNYVTRQIRESKRIFYNRKLDHYNKDTKIHGRL